LSLWSRAAAQDQIVITKEFVTIDQGSVGIIKVTGGDLAGGVAVVFERQYPFFATSQGVAALISVDMLQRIKDYPIAVTLYRSDGSSLGWEDVVTVSGGGFIAESNFVLPTDRMNLLNPEVQANEDLRLRTVFGLVTPQRFWDGPVSLPLNGRLGSPFGSLRTYTDGQQRRHTGVDLSTGAGVPIAASANGRVVFARQLDIHGNHVVVDHGWGVFSAYSHLSALYVVPGQMVLQGDILGLTGNTGRSTGPHLHWEIAVNGIWVDPIRFVQIKLPN
jgi:murein DD-endopeptidase MepM/ murein hydrolase activator NlpD